MRGQTNTSSDYTPYQKTVYFTGWGVNTPTQGVVTYRRTGYKKGVLSGQFRINANNRTTPYHQSNIANFNLAGFGVTFKAPTNTKMTGSWIVSNDSADSTAIYGYGTAVAIYANGDIAFGRYYVIDGQYGGWPDGSFNDRYITFSDVEIEEV